MENQYYGRVGIEKEVFPLQRDSMPQIGKQGGLSGYMEKYKAMATNLSNAKQGWNELMADHGYKANFDAFIDSVINDTPTPCNELDGYRATYLGELAMKSIELNKPLPVAVDKWDYYVEP